MGNGDKPAAVTAAVGNTVVLGLDDDVLQRAWLDQLKEHTQKAALFLDVTHQYRHASALVQGAELLHHAVVHRLDKAFPGWNPGEIKTAGVIPIPLLHV